MPKKNNSNRVGELSFNCPVPKFLQQYQNLLGESRLCKGPVTSKHEEIEEEPVILDENGNTISKEYADPFYATEDENDSKKDLDIDAEKERKPLIPKAKNNNKVHEMVNQLSKDMKGSVYDESRIQKQGQEWKKEDFTQLNQQENEIKKKELHDKNLVTVGIHKKQQKKATSKSQQKKNLIQNKNLLSFGDDSE
ncbi:hypothetical protein WA158_000717 [Blastocystis sp. Blastoise]